MLKMVYAWRDHPDLSPEECEQHYRTVHMELAREAFTGIDGFHALVYNRVRRHAVNDHNEPEALDRPTDMDAFLELYVRDRSVLEQAFARPQMRRLFEDHANFMAVNIPANVRIYEVEEEVYFGERP